MFTRDDTRPIFDPRKTAHRRPGLDLLRALAILFVVIYHAGLFGFVLPYRMQRFGWIGVDLFFVLSGYLIGGQLLSRVAGGHEPGIGGFYWRRALRILPAYLVIVASYFFLPGALREYERMPPVWKFLTFTQNLGLRGGTAFSHAWSLCIEFQFYLVLPLLILALARKARSSVAILVPIAILVWCLVIRGLLARVNLNMPQASFGWWQQWIYYPTYSRLDSLTIGVSLAAIECFRPHWWSLLTKSATWLWVPGIGAIALALFLAEDGLSIASSVFGFFLVAAGCGIFLICAVSPRVSISRVAIPGATFLATMAYSIYLSHKLAIHWVEDLCAARAIGTDSIAAYLLMTAAIVILGSALFFAVERPFLKMREKKTPKVQRSTAS
jgi:peptidoglycan/LPS O-acetylase OafA/YrhL